MRHIYCTLIATDNEYLKPRLPLSGYLEIFEESTMNTINKAVFRIEKLTKDGLDGGPVEVKNPQFIYTGAYPSKETREAFRRNQSPS